MFAKIYSAAVYGVDAYEVEIEVNGAGGDPNIVIVGIFSPNPFTSSTHRLSTRPFSVSFEGTV